MIFADHRHKKCKDEKCTWCLVAFDNQPNQSKGCKTAKSKTLPTGVAINEAVTEFIFTQYLPDNILQRLLGAIPTSYNESSHTSIKNKVNKKRSLGPETYESAIKRGALEYQIGNTFLCFAITRN